MSNNPSLIKNISIIQSLKNYYTKVFDFKGEATRTEYSVGVIFQWIMSVGFVVVVGAAIKAVDGGSGGYENASIQALQWGWWLVAFLPSFALAFRRSRHAVNGVWAAVLNYVALVLVLVSYTAVFALYSFPSEFQVWFWVSVGVFVLTLMASFFSFALLLFKTKES